MLGTPYVAGSLSSAANSATYGVPVGSPVAPGTALVIFAGASGSTTATGVTDSQGNAYALVASSVAGEFVQAFTGTATAGLNPLAGDSWTVTYSAANTQQKNIITVAAPGASGTADVAVPANGSSTSPSATGSAASGNEVAIACIQDASAGGAPGSWNLTSLGTLSSAGQPFMGVAYGYVTARGTVTASAVITSAAWSALLVTLPVSAPVALGPAQAPYGGAQLPPFPVIPAPRTWSPKDKILTSRLRADPGNALLLLANPPLAVVGQTVTTQSVPTATVTLLSMDTEMIDTWQDHTVPQRSIFPSLAGWYLTEGFVFINDTTTAKTAAAGILAFGNGTGFQSDGGKVTDNGVNFPVPSVVDLIPVNPATADSIGLYAWHDAGTARPVASAWLKTEWVAALAGTVVSSPVPAAGWTSGATALLAPVSAGATSLLLADPAGVVVGGTIGLDFGNGPEEDVTVTSVAGQTIGTSACAYPHLATAPVSVPVSAAFMNQQVRDKINFLSYRPVARLVNTGVSQSLASQVFPAGTALQMASPVSTARCVDNFSGWAAGQPTRYVFPVAGTYFVYGQVCLTDAASAVTVSAGLAISGGTIQWGDRVLSAGSTSEGVCATVRRVLRVTAGQYVEVYGSQASGGPLAVKSSGNSLSKLIVVHRGN